MYLVVVVAVLIVIAIIIISIIIGSKLGLSVRAFAFNANIKCEIILIVVAK